MDYKTIDNKNNKNIKITKQKKNINYGTCIYNEICSEGKMCGDCCADSYDRELSDKFLVEFKIDRQMGEFKGRR